jgi:hypothetical protein
MKKIIKLTGFCGQLPINTIQVFVNSYEMEYEVPTEIEWNDSNTLRIRIKGDEDICEFSDLPISKTVEFDRVLLNFSIVEVQL